MEPNPASGVPFELVFSVNLVALVFVLATLALIDMLLCPNKSETEAIHELFPSITGHLVVLEMEGCAAAKEGSSKSATILIILTMSMM